MLLAKFLKLFLVDFPPPGLRVLRRDQVRVPLLPDNDRTWYSIGATNRITPSISVDLAYSFVDVKTARSMWFPAIRGSTGR